MISNDIEIVILLILIVMVMIILCNIMKVLMCQCV